MRNCSGKDVVFLFAGCVLFASCLAADEVQEVHAVSSSEHQVVNNNGGLTPFCNATATRGRGSVKFDNCANWEVRNVLCIETVEAKQLSSLTESMKVCFL